MIVLPRAEVVKPLKINLRSEFMAERLDASFPKGRDFTPAVYRRMPSGAMLRSEGFLL
jgi:hypothetical protein